MPLQDIEDPNAGRTAGRPNVTPSAQVARAGAVPQLQVDPLTSVIMSNADKIIGEELRKEKKKDYLRGQLQIQQGQTIQDVRENSPIVEQVFGQGATTAGAQAMIMQKAQEDYQLKIIANMETIRKMSPDEFVDAQAEDLGEMLTGDEDTDTMITLMSESMFAKAAETHMPAYLDWVQEDNANAFGALSDSAVRSYEAGLKQDNITEEQKERLTQDFMSAINKPAAMYDGNYQKLMGQLVLDRLEQGEDAAYQVAKAVKFQFSPDQFLKMNEARAGWEGEQEKRKAHTLGQQMADINRLADAGASDGALHKSMRHMEASIADGYRLDGSEVTRILMRGLAGRKKKGAANAKKLGATAWINGENMTVNSSLDEFSSIWLTSSYLAPDPDLSPEQLQQARTTVVERFIGHNRVDKMMQRNVAAALAQPMFSNGQPNPQFDQSYTFYRDVRATDSTGQLLNQQFTPQQQAVFNMYESTVRSSDQLTALAQMKSVLDNPLPPGYDADTKYVTEMDDNVSAAQVGWLSDKLPDSWGTRPSNGGQLTLDAAYKQQYPIIFQATQDHNATATTMDAYMANNFYTDGTGEVHKLPRAAVMSNAGLPEGANYKDTLASFLNEKGTGGFDGDQHVLYSNNGTVMFVNTPHEDGSIGTKVFRTEEIGVHAREQRGIKAALENAGAKEDAFNTQLAKARTHWQLSNRVGNFEIMDEYPPDDKLVTDYINFQRDNEGQLGTTDLVSAIGDIFTDGGEIGKYNQQQLVDERTSSFAQAEEWIAHKYTK